MYDNNFLNGLRGLTANERQAWEKDNILLIMGKDEDEKNQLFLDLKFDEAFKDNPNYAKWKAYDVASRNSLLELYNKNVAFKQRFSSDPYYESMKELPVEARNEILDNALLDDALIEKWGKDPLINEFLSFNPDVKRGLLNSTWKSNKEMQERKEELEKLGAPFKGVASFAADKITSSSVIGNLMPVVSLFVARHSAESLTDAVINKIFLGEAEDNEAILNSFRKIDNELKELSSLKDIYNTLMEITQMAQEPNGELWLQELLDKTLGGGKRTYTDAFNNKQEYMSPGSAYYKAFRDENSILERVGNVGLTTASGAAVGGSLTGGTGALIGGAGGFSAGMIGELYGNHPTIDNMPIEKKIQLYAKYLTFLNKYGETAALSAIDTDLRQYFADEQNIADRLENDVRGIGIGATTLLMNDYLALRTITKAASGDANYLQGLDENGEELPWYDNPKLWQDFELTKTLSKHYVNLARESKGLSKYLNLYETDEPNFSQFWDSAIDMSKFAISGKAEGTLLGGAGKLLGAAFKGKFVNGAGEVAKGLNILKADAVMAEDANAASLIVYKGYSGYILPLLSSTSISQAYAMGTFEDTYLSLKDELEKDKYLSLEEEVEKQLQSKESQAIIRAKARELMNNDRLKLSPELLGNLIEDGYINYATDLYRDVLRKQLADSIDKNFEEREEQIGNAALAAYLADYTIEDMAMALATRYTFRKMLLDKGTRKAMGLTGSGMYNTAEGNKIVTKGKPTSLGKVAFWQFFGGFESNFHDDVRVDFAKGFGLSKYNDDVSNTYNSEDYINNNMLFFGNLFDGMAYSATNYFAFQHWYDGLIGGSGVFFNTAIKGKRSLSLSNQDVPESFTDRLSKYIYNPVLEEYQETKEADRYVKALAELLNSVVEKNLDNLINTSKLITSLRTAHRNSQDPQSSVIDMLDNKGIMTFNLVSALDAFSKNEALKDVESYKKALQLLLDVLNDNADELGLISDYLTDSDNKLELMEYNRLSDEEKLAKNEEILNKIKENAQFISDFQSNYVKYSREVMKDPFYLKEENSKAASQLVFQLTMQDLWKDRMSSMEKELTDNDEVSNNGSMIAYYGDKGSSYKTYKQSTEKLLETVNAEINKTVEELLLAKDKIKEEQQGKPTDDDIAKVSSLLLKLDELNYQKEQITDLLTEVNADEDLFEGPSLNRILTAEEIIRLKPKDRWEMLNPVNAHRFSNAQQAEINKAKKQLQKKDSEYLDKLEDLAILDLRVQNNEHSIALVKSHPREALMYINAVLASELYRAEGAIRALNVYQTSKLINKVKKSLKNLGVAVDNNELKKLVLSALHPQVVEDWIAMNPNDALLLQPALEMAKFRRDIKLSLDKLFLDNTYKNAFKVSIDQALDGVLDVEEGKKILESIIDSPMVNDANKEQFNKLLEELALLGYLRDATVLINREEQRKIKEKKEQQRLKRLEAKKGSNYGFDGYNVGDTFYLDNGDEAVITSFSGNKDNGVAKYKLTKDKTKGSISVTLKDSLHKNPPKKEEPKVVKDSDYFKKDKETSGDIIYKQDKNGKITAIANKNKKQLMAISILAEANEISTFDEFYKNLTENKKLVFEDEDKARLKDAFEAYKNKTISEEDLLDFLSPSKQQAPKAPETQLLTKDKIVEETPINIVFDEKEGLAITPSLEEETASNSKVLVSTVPIKDTTDGGNVIDNNSPVALLGNPMAEYEYNTLVEEGRLVHKKGNLEGDSMNQFFKWLEDSGIKLQLIIDNELGEIIKNNPDTKVRFLVTKPDNSAMDNYILLAIPFDSSISKIHNKEFGGVIGTLSGQYLIIGTLGFNNSVTDLRNAFNSLKTRVLNNRDNYFTLNPKEDFYVDLTMYTQVRQINAGRITRLLLLDTGVELRSIKQLLKNPDGSNNDLRNPEKLELEDLKWGIALNLELKLFGVNENEVHRNINLLDNAGGVFLLIQTADGKYMPASVKTGFYNELKEGALKTAISQLLVKCISSNLAERLGAIKELCKLLVMPLEGPTILVGSALFPDNITIKGKNNTTIGNFDLHNPDLVGFLKAIETANFKINVSPSVLTNPTLLEMYDDAGVFSTDLASLRTSGAGFNVYNVNLEGVPIITPVVQSRANKGSDLLSTKKVSVFIGKLTYRLKNNVWVDASDRPIDNSTLAGLKLLLDCFYNNLIQQTSMNPTETVKSKSGRDLEYYIIKNNKEDALVVVRYSDNHTTVVKNPTESRKYIEGFNARQAEKQRAENALRELNKTRNLTLTKDLIAEETPIPITIEDITEQIVGHKVQEATNARVGENNLNNIEQLSKIVKDINKAEKKAVSRLQENEKLTNFATIIKNKESRDKIKDVFTEKGWDITTPAKMKEFLISKGIPVENIVNVDSWIENIKSCH